MKEPHYTEAERLAQLRGERHQSNLVWWSQLAAIGRRGLEATERGDALAVEQARIDLLNLLRVDMPRARAA